jgi:very-short-patch-repair endonuclease
MYVNDVKATKGHPLPGGEGQGEGERNLEFSYRREIQVILNKHSHERARSLRKQPTWAAKLMWRWLRGRRFNCYKFRREHPVGPYVLDFFCEEAKLNVELDGRGHGFPDQRKHDVRREQFLQSQGIKTLRFWNSHLRRNARNIRDTVLEELQKRAPHPLLEYTKSTAFEGKE